MTEEYNPEHFTALAGQVLSWLKRIKPNQTEDWYATQCLYSTENLFVAQTYPTDDALYKALCKVYQGRGPFSSDDAFYGLVDIIDKDARDISSYEANNNTIYLSENFDKYGAERIESARKLSYEVIV